MALTLDRSLFLRVASALALMPVVIGALLYGGIAFAVMLALALAVSIYEWVRMAKLSTKPALYGAAGVAYIILAIVCFGWLRLYEAEGAGLALALMLSVWASDSGAYFAGKIIGGPKMAPKISPNKTWAGLIGGVAASTATIVVYDLYVGPFLSSLLNMQMQLPEGIYLPQAIFLGVLVTIGGQAGDLLISKMKRAVGVKDTGNLIPGHGGLLDRIDALLLAAIAFLLALKVLGL